MLRADHRNPSTAGTEAAFGRRRTRETKLRLAAYRGIRIAGTRYTRAFPDFYEFIPEIRTAHDLADLSARVACYLSDTGVPLYLAGARFPLRPELVPHFDPSLVRDPGWVGERPKGTGHLVVHRVTPATVRRIVTHAEPSTVVDSRLHTRSEEMYFAMRNATTWPTYPPAEIGLQRLRQLSAPGGTAFILATGPSALTVDIAHIDADVRITCNSAVRDLDRIREFKPNIICFTDPVFHFGPSRYAAGFRRDAVRAAEAVDALVICGHAFAGPLLGWHPELRDRLVVLPYQDGGPWRWPTDRNPTVRQGSNVMTTLMLPVALMLADHISIAGADGRQPTENYFWKHNPRLQYSDDLMQTVFDSHPAFFRDRDYADYYDEFCSNLEALVQAGESAGKTIRSAAPSWIPALRRRGATEPEGA
jgi:hypothetical protein